MWEIGYLILCEDIFNNGDDRVYKNPLSGLQPVNIPGNFSFKVAFSIFNRTLDNRNEKNTLRMLFKDPEDNILNDTGEINFQFEGEVPEDATFEVGEAGIGMNNVVLPVEGIYTLEVRINDNKKTLKVPVGKQKGIKDDVNGKD
ncbi:hypothetical protein P8917_08920 [Bacillus atrophaeus]|uniref:DUF6941 family protein n=1 Tax=Bacillus atrophaeus TaxID=1452 RepID=UPI0022816E50|nr:hypothetical protein [Bacillus atrophaeus]MCY8499879.1 hypothetical protein [Bacillus atrophaeus]MCY8812670.1 hypothetical protein [Bacillus atrophaeus]MCY8819408.1 hypothetical protein [Bacillus atrophaeus]MCY8829833.1 hypothetical protein [Bacillus atrophaeus]MCY8833945.1 hypothetical protein [Bacillus atrophaeus]